MKVAKIILSLTFIANTAFANDRASHVTYVISSDCISGIEVIKDKYIEDKYVDDWAMVILLNDDESKKLFVFSKDNLNKRIFMVDGNGKSLMENGVYIREPISSRFQLSGFESEEKATLERARLLSSNGACGEK